MLPSKGPVPDNPAYDPERPGASPMTHPRPGWVLVDDRDHPRVAAPPAGLLDEPPHLAGRGLIDADHHPRRPPGAAPRQPPGCGAPSSRPLERCFVPAVCPDGASGTPLGPVLRAGPVPEIQEGPAICDGVWIALESCDPSRPIWLGQRITDWSRAPARYIPHPTGAESASS